MNDSVNDIASAEQTIRSTDAIPVILYPGDSWNSELDPHNASALQRYERAYAGIRDKPLNPPGASVDLTMLQKHALAYRERVLAKNSEWMIRALRRVPAAGFFHPVRIYLSDLDLVAEVSVLDGVRRVHGDAEVVMHSSSLDFIFLQEFGYDTLTVNGRFEATPSGFAHMTKSLAIGSLNAMGLSLSFSLLRDVDLVLILLGRLTQVVRRLKARNGVQTAEIAPANRDGHISAVERGGQRPN